MNRCQKPKCKQCRDELKDATRRMADERSYVTFLEEQRRALQKDAADMVRLLILQHRTELAKKLGEWLPGKDPNLREMHVPVSGGGHETR